MALSKTLHLPLALFPTEICYKIVCLLSMVDMHTIWSTNDSLLRSKLASRTGIKYYQFYDNSICPRKHILPTCFRRSFLLNLRGLMRLSITCTSFTDKSFPQLHQGILSQLSSTLQFIEFHFVDAEECWLRTKQRTEPLETFVKTRFDFEKHFPSLHVLVLGMSSATKHTHEQLLASFAHFDYDDLCLLPPSLTRLDLPYNTSLLPDSWSPHSSPIRCASSLESFYVGVSLPAVRSLPSSIDASFFAGFQSLLSLDFQSGATPLSQQIIPMLPRTLTRLFIPIGELSSEYVARLPPQLTTLSLRFRGANNGLNQDDLCLLPQSLTDLRYRAINHSPFSPDWLTLLPPKLLHATVFRMEVRQFDFCTQGHASLLSLLFDSMTLYKLPTPRANASLGKTLYWSSLDGLIVDSDMNNLKSLVQGNTLINREHELEACFHTAAKCGSLEAITYILSLTSISADLALLRQGFDEAMRANVADHLLQLISSHPDTNREAVNPS